MNKKRHADEDARNPGRIIITVCLFLVAVFACFCAFKTYDKVSGAEKKLEAIQKEFRLTETEKESLTQKIREQSEQLTQLETEIQTDQNRLNVLNGGQS